MAYAVNNFKTKKALKEHVADVNARGATFKYIDMTPSGSFIADLKPGETAYLEGPHAPEPHTWYATVKNKDGKVVVS